MRQTTFAVTACSGALQCRWLSCVHSACFADSPHIVLGGLQVSNFRGQAKEVDATFASHLISKMTEVRLQT